VDGYMSISTFQSNAVISGFFSVCMYLSESCTWNCQAPAQCQDCWGKVWGELVNQGKLGSTLNLLVWCKSLWFFQYVHWFMHYGMVKPGAHDMLGKAWGQWANYGTLPNGQEQAQSMTWRSGVVGATNFQ
jgi:hypothetical protein